MTRLIGLTGQAGAGKTTFATLLGEYADTLAIAFADPLRDVSQAIFGSRYETQAQKANVDCFWRRRLGADWATGRRILQRLGTEVMRGGIHPDIWVWAMERRLESLDGAAEVIVIQDVRFPNEAAMVRAKGGIVIQLVNANQPVTRDPHPSEQPIPIEHCDHVLTARSVGELGRLARWIAMTELGLGVAK